MKWFDTMRILNYTIINLVISKRLLPNMHSTKKGSVASINHRKKAGIIGVMKPLT